MKSFSSIPIISCICITRGSNTSIPELIKQQGERQSTRQTSNQGPRRPLSGHKVPPSPTHQQAQRRPSATESGKDTGDSSQRRLNAFINGKNICELQGLRPSHTQAIKKMITITTQRERIIGWMSVCVFCVEHFNQKNAFSLRHDLYDCSVTLPWGWGTCATKKPTERHNSLVV